jgi:SPP1 gp7 family putative phage head morphogenesis protein
MEEQLGKAITRELAVESLLFEMDVENGLLKKVAWPLYLEAAQQAGQSLMVELGADPEIFTLVDTPAMAALETKLIKVVGINETIRDQLRNSLMEGIGQMDTTAELMGRVRQVYNFAQSRALTIARTETGQAASLARDAGMAQMGVAKIRWVTAGDEHVRARHQELSGMVVE